MSELEFRRQGTAAAHRGGDALHAVELQVIVAVVVQHHVGAVARGGGNLGDEVLSLVAPAHGDGARGAVLHLDFKGDGGFVVLGDHVLVVDVVIIARINAYIAGLILCVLVGIVGVAPHHGLHILELDFAGIRINGRRVLADAGVDLIDEVLQRAVPVHSDGDGLAVAQHEVIGDAGRIGKGGVALDGVVAFPDGLDAGIVKAQQFAAFDGKAVGFARILARNLEVVTAAGLDQAGLDAGIFLVVVHQVDERIQRGVRRHGDAVILAGVVVLELDILVGGVDDIGLVLEQVAGIGPDGVVGHLLDVDPVLGVNGVGRGRAGDELLLGAGHHLGHEAVAVLEAAQLRAGRGYGFDNLGKALIPDIPVALPCLQSREVHGLDLLQLFERLGPVVARSVQAGKIYGTGNTCCHTVFSSVRVIAGPDQGRPCRVQFFLVIAKSIPRKNFRPADTTRPRRTALPCFS